MATAQQDRPPPEKKKERPSALRSIIAGSTAGAVEIGSWTPAAVVPLIWHQGSLLIDD